MQTTTKIRIAHRYGKSVDMIAKQGYSMDCEIVQGVMLNEPAVTLNHTQSVRCLIDAVERDPSIQFGVKYLHFVAPSTKAERKSMMNALVALFCITRSAPARLTPRHARIHTHGAWSPKQKLVLDDLNIAEPSRLVTLLPRDHPLVPVVSRIVARVHAAGQPRPPTTRQEKLCDALKTIPARFKPRTKQAQMAQAHEMGLRRKAHLAQSSVDTPDMLRTPTHRDTGSLSRHNALQCKNTRQTRRALMRSMTKRWSAPTPVMEACRSARSYQTADIPLTSILKKA
ncbi:hypothetical protein BD626DRAFT_563276 [Schizophyllum amplum]|uniref:Uncharacterized protein n=1 Tax=Schizophyllum amplum TaxID=97359 RepID=A0A550CXL9_9AGAR|nr:hypothetical protein BD626DRAFT_563276 [Auriculariopsis ampla]